MSSDDVRRINAELGLTELVREIAATAPALTDAQLDHLRRLLPTARDVHLFTIGNDP